MRRIFLIIALTLTIACALCAVAKEIPHRPEKLIFPTLTYEPPDPATLSSTLANGVRAYVVEDRQLPLVSVTILFRGGKYLEPKGKEGLAELVGIAWRSGGAGNLDPKALDEELDFLAADLSTRVGGSTGSISLNLLAKDLERGLAILMDVVQNPRFAPERVAKAKEDMISKMQRRNDDSGEIEEREWDRLIYGENFWRNQLATKISVDAITQADLTEFHRKLANPANFVLAVSGDFNRQTMLEKLNKTIGAISVTGTKVPPVSQPTSTTKSGIYLVNKSDVNQGRVSIGHRSAMRPQKDEFEITVANDILGAGETAWITTKVRSDEGLAYEAYSFYAIGDLYPSDFRAIFQTKSSTVARATNLTLDLINQIRAKSVTEKELVTSKNSMIDSFPRNFETKQSVVNVFAMDDLLGRSHEYWKTYRDKVKGVTVAGVKAAANVHIKPDQLIILVVGNVAEILKKNPDYPDLRLSRFGPMTRVPLRDPLTQQPIVE